MDTPMGSLLQSQTIAHARNRSFPYPPSKTARHSHHTESAEQSARNAPSATEHCHTEATASARFKVWLPIDLLTGQMVNIRRTDGTWQPGIVNGNLTNGPHPHLIVRFLNGQWKRVLISEVDAKIQPHAGQEILQRSLAAAGATPRTEHATEIRNTQISEVSDTEISDTEIVQALDEFQRSRDTSCVLQSSRAEAMHHLPTNR